MLGLASILLLGIGAQWLAWRFRFPSILLLLLVGFLAGPLSNQRLLDPDNLLGNALLPFVSLAVATILLEGGLTLRFQDLKGAGGAVRNLVIIGCPVTCVLATLSARWILDMDWRLSLLLGALLVVTGPTVIVPLLRHVRPSGMVGSVVRWEGIVTDPIGAILAVLVFQTILITESEVAATAAAIAGLMALVVGTLAGGLGAFVLILLLRRNLVPDFLHTGVSLAIGIGVFVASNSVQHESGLLSVTLMGILLANQKFVIVEHIVEFKENLRVLLISSLFILLAARLPMEELTRFDLRSVGFVLALIFVVRPISVYLSTIGVGLNWRERVFVAWMAPRGIVAAAVAAVFALELGAVGYPGSDRLVSVVFAVILITVMVYGLTASHLARWLGLSEGNPQGVLIVGAHDWSRELAKALKDSGIRVLLTDTSRKDVRAARMRGLDTHYGSILSEEFEEFVSLDGLGYMLCLTHNDQVNSLACLQFTPWFGRASVYQLAPEGDLVEGEGGAMSKHLRGRDLFSSELSYWDIHARFRRGAIVKATTLSDEFDYQDFLNLYADEDAPPIPLFVVTEEGLLKIAGGGEALAPGEDDTVIALVQPEESEEKVAAPGPTEAALP